MMRHVLPHAVLAVALGWFLFLPSALAQQTKFTLDIDVTKGTSDPADPLVHSAGDEFFTIRILQNGVTPAENVAQLRFAYPIYDLSIDAQNKVTAATLKSSSSGTEDAYTIPGTQHSVSFRPCSSDERDKLKRADGSMAVECPAIVRRGRAIVVIANTDVIPIEAVVDVRTDPSLNLFAEANIRRTVVTIRTVRPYWRLNWSAGLTFFPGVRDEQYELSAIASDTENQKITRVDDGDIPYELAAFATYMFSRPRLPVGVTVGLSTTVPASDVSVMVGSSVRIMPFPVTDSAYLTVGVAYTSRNRLLAQYRGDSTVPVGLTAANILHTEKDLGFFVALSFGFAGGKDEFTKIVSGK